MSFCEMSNMLPSGSCVLMPANGRVDGRLSHFTVGYFLRMRSKTGLGVLDLDAEMVEAGGAPGAARIDVQADIAVAHRDRPARPGLVRGLHAERRDVELRELGVVFADDGDVIDLREHSCLPAGRPDSSVVEWRIVPDFRPRETVTPPAPAPAGASRRRAGRTRPPASRPRSAPATSGRRSGCRPSRP